MADYSLRKFSNDLENHGFKNCFLKVFNNDIINLEEKEKIKLLELSISLLNSEDKNLFNLGYYIIVSYSIMTGDYYPLYDISDKLLNFPIINFLERKNIISKSNDIFAELSNIVMSQNKVSDDFYYSADQKKMNLSFFREKGDMMVVAPTSFGKTDLIKRFIKENFDSKVICIIEPTKAMLNQVRTDLLEEFKAEKPKIITHYDMNFDKKDKVILVMTQERLFKLIYDRKKDIKIDVLLVDEAHNMFEKNSRAFLLAKLIYLLRSKNGEMVVKYFSPIIVDANNLKIKNDSVESVNSYKAEPIMKIERIHYADFFRKKSYDYNQFFNEFYEVSNLFNLDKYNYVIANSSKKNLLYLNRPKDLKLELPLICKFLGEIQNDKIEEICKNLKEYVNREYDLIDYIRKGVVYHCGVMPDNVRIYIEKCVKENDFIKYIFCTSTLLEGVNMPFDRLFILDIKKGRSNLTYHQLKNLVGRINRYRNIFDLKNNDLGGLISNVYFIKARNEVSNFEDFIKTNLKVESNSNVRMDILQNPLLANSSTILSDDEEAKIENLVENKESNNIKKVKTPIGKLLLELNINDFNIFDYEELISKRINEKICDEEDSIVDKIFKIFIDDIEIVSDDKNNIVRLKNESARRFYNLVIGWRKKNYSISQCVEILYAYWKKLSDIDKEYVYVGRSFGEIKRNDDDRIPLYVNLNNKLRKEIINLAIVRVKEENDYIDYYLFKYIDLLYKVKLIDKQEYNLIHYGTNDESQIFFQRDGLSRELSKLLAQDYFEYIVNVDNIYLIDKKILNVFDENEILKYELECYLR